MKLVVGLGNPERSYVGTRHNVGFEVIDQLASKLGWAKPDDFDRVARRKFDGLAMDGIVGSEKLVLLKPTTYMNLSGKAVQAAMAFYQLTPQDIMVVLDDLALPVGRLRLRGSGSSGGHNGLKDIERALASGEYPRLRVGIDPAPPRVAGRDYVLGKFTPEQRVLLEPALGRACGAIVTWIDKGIETAMNQFNAGLEKSDGVTE
ncbi:MAG: aminoacyl-tRNA hydrolase [Tepidisphaeraceae bacterium]